MKQIKEPKMVKVLVNITCEKRDEHLVQTYRFTVTNKKYINYLFDVRFLFSKKIEKLIRNNLLPDYEKRVDGEDFIEMWYEYEGNIPRPMIKNIESYVPPTTGCQYCSQAEIEGDFIYCPIKNKHYHKSEGGVQRCPVFRCKEEIIT